MKNKSHESISDIWAYLCRLENQKVLSLISLFTHNPLFCEGGCHVDAYSFGNEEIKTAAYTCNDTTKYGKPNMCQCNMLCIG